MGRQRRGIGQPLFDFVATGVEPWLHRTAATVSGERRTRAITGEWKQGVLVTLDLSTPTLPTSDCACDRLALGAAGIFVVGLYRVPLRLFGADTAILPVAGEQRQAHTHLQCHHVGK